MARLIVSAVSEDLRVLPGSRQPDTVFVSVTDLSGMPVLALTEDNFTVAPLIVTPEEMPVAIGDVAPGPLPGVYQLNVLPEETVGWLTGVYIFTVAVEKGEDRGQVLATMLLN